MIIIYQGKLAITAQIDKQELVIDYINKGAVMNSHNFLSGRRPQTAAKCLTIVTYYFLPLYKLQAISEGYPELRNALKYAQNLSNFKKSLDLDPLDYKEGRF